jgi:hypothetical protein
MTSATAVGCGKGGVEPLRDGVELGLRLADAHPGAEPADSLEVAVVARIRRGVEKVGYPQLHVVGEGEAARHDPDERRRRARAQCLAEDGRIAAETALPETIADDRRRCQPRVHVAPVEVAADRRRNSQYREEVGLEHAGNPLRAPLRRGRP